MSMAVEPPTAVEADEYTSITPGERSIIMPFRYQYEHEYKRVTRIAMLKGEICSAIFNYWKREKIEPPTTALFKQRLNAIMAFVRNNWRRPRRIQLDTSGTVSVRIHDLIWEFMPDKVEARIMELAKSDTPISYKDVRFLQYLNVAISEVRKKLSVPQIAWFDAKKEERRRLGNPPEKQLRIYHKDGALRVRKAAASQWLEMGMLQLTIGAVQEKDNRWVLEVYDNTALNMGVKTKSFCKLWPDEMQDIQRKFLQYLRHLDDLKHPDRPPTEPNMKGKHHTQIKNDPTTGFPRMPDPPADNSHQGWKELAPIMRNYLSAHYYLASGHKYVTAPFTAIESRCSDFIDVEYLPAGMVFKDPNYMNRDDIMKFIQQIRDRQTSGPMENVFRFKAYRDNRTTMMPALYNGSNATAEAAKDAEQQSTRRKKASKKKGKKAAKAQPSASDVAGSDHDEEMHMWNENGGDLTWMTLPGGRGENIAGPHATANKTINASTPDPNVGMVEVPEASIRSIADTSTTPPVVVPHTVPNIISAAHGSKLQNTAIHSNIPQPPLNNLAGNIEIDQQTYERIRENRPGLVLTAVNGPADGPPRYEVTRSIWDKYMSTIVVNAAASQNQSGGCPVLPNFTNSVIYDAVSMGPVGIVVSATPDAANRNTVHIGEDIPSTCIPAPHADPTRNGQGNRGRKRSSNNFIGKEATAGQGNRRGKKRGADDMAADEAESLGAKGSRARKPRVRES
ncbi:hypothetical protein BDN70DRAFT_939008 [Pholiota conissans]|uniref:Uncharacterized protein n=1 Tax=Pholiota conissans TaxID=109636 RepID=A0A9P5YLZ0_9AGAR|nr:hypothetical protein BDN70DRAFT_939008 [Pholiota conissans]